MNKHVQGMLMSAQLGVGQGPTHVLPETSSLSPTDMTSDLNSNTEVTLSHVWLGESRGGCPISHPTESGISDLYKLEK